MIKTYRLCRAEFKDLDGEGAKMYGGRWNFRGYPLVYTSSQLSLAVLELLVHTDADLIPNGLICLEIEIPNKVSIENMQLPTSYLKSQDSNILKEIGTTWLKEKRSAVLTVPSIIVPIENNLLINPLHPESSAIKITKEYVFNLDPRLF
jgi:RES domain-containing protein